MTSDHGPRRLTRAAALAVLALMAQGLTSSSASAGGHCKKVYVLVDDTPAPTTTRVVRRYVREVAAPDAEPDRDTPSPQSPARDAVPPPKNAPQAARDAAPAPAPAPKMVTRRVLRTYVEEEQVPAEETREVVARDVPVTRVVRVVRTVPAETVVYREVAPATQAVLVTKKCCLFGKGY